MTDHTHSQYVEGCFRCDLSRDEVASGYITAAMIEQGRKAREGHYLRVSPVSCTCGWRSDTYVEADGLPRFEAHLVELALEAAAPAIAAQALRDAADELRRLDDGRTGGYYDAGRHIIRRLDARADEIERGES